MLGHLYESMTTETVQSAAAPRMLARKYVCGMRYSRVWKGRYPFLVADARASAWGTANGNDEARGRALASRISEGRKRCCVYSNC